MVFFIMILYYIIKNGKFSVFFHDIILFGLLHLHSPLFLLVALLFFQIRFYLI